MNDDDFKIYEAFVKIMFEEWDADSMAYMHIVQQQAIQDEADAKQETSGVEYWTDYGDWQAE